MARSKNYIYDAGRDMVGRPRADDGWSRLAAAVLRQAFADYYKDCIPLSRVPKRPLRRTRGRMDKHINDCPEYQRRGMEKDREIRRQAELDFFHSDWYLILSTQTDFELVDKVLRKIEEKREMGLPLYEQSFDLMDEDEKESNYGDSSIDPR